MKVPDSEWNPPPRPPINYKGRRKPKPVTIAWAIFVGLILIAALAGGLGRSTGGGGSGDVNQSVRYSVTGGPGTGAADLTYSDDQENTAQEASQSLPWSYTFYAAPGTFLYISAQNRGYGDITCTIYVDGLERESTTSSGQYTICDASGTL